MVEPDYLKTLNMEGNETQEKEFEALRHLLPRTAYFWQKVTEIRMKKNGNQNTQTFSYLVGNKSTSVPAATERHLLGRPAVLCCLLWEIQLLDLNLPHKRNCQCYTFIRRVARHTKMIGEGGQLPILCAKYPVPCRPAY